MFYIFKVILHKTIMYYTYGPVFSQIAKLYIGILLISHMRMNSCYLKIGVIFRTTRITFKD